MTHFSVNQRRVRIIRFFVQIADKMKYEGMFKEDISVLVASLAAPISLRHRKEQLQHEINCLELKKRSLEYEIDADKE